MPTINETGHAKNLANFNELISFVSSYGRKYAPSKDSIKLVSLQNHATVATNALSTVNTAQAAYTNAVVARENAFAPLSKFITRVMNSLRATDTTVQTDESAKTLARKIQGIRTTPKLTDEEKVALEADGKSTKEISSSQMSFDNRLEYFDKLIQLLTSITLYVPNETELQVASLTTLYNDLKTKNTAVINTFTALSNARIARNETFYNPNSGLIDIAFDVKSYVKSLFGADGPQFKQVSKIPFRLVKA